MRLLILLFYFFSFSLSAAPITLDIPALPLDDAIKLLAKYADMNVVLGASVQGMTALSVKQVEPLQALDTLLVTQGLQKTKTGNIWVVTTRAEMSKNLQEQAEMRFDKESAASLVSQVWKIRYAKAVDIAGVLAGEGAALVSERGQVRVDARTNIIFVRDTAERIQMLNHLIHRLDVPVQQVLIEARLVSIDQDAEQVLGFNFSVRPEEGGVGRLPALPAKVESVGRYSIAIAHLPDGSLLDVKLAALEQQGRAELISSPSLFTGSYQEASIESGEEVPYQEVSESGGTAVAFKKAVLGLTVTPQILPGGQVLLALKINQDRPENRMVQGVPTISTRQIVTNVQVKSGKTIVLGGIYEVNHEQGQEGLPFLGNIPLIGLLFKQQNKRDHKRELLVFVTPKIMPQAI